MPSKGQQTLYKKDRSSLRIPISSQCDHPSPTYRVQFYERGVTKKEKSVTHNNNKYNKYKKTDAQYKNRAGPIEMLNKYIEAVEDFPERRI